jgi:hypothetical protein
MGGCGITGERPMSKSSDSSDPFDADWFRYFMSPFAVVLWGTALICDLIYPFVFAQIRESERVLPDGRKVAGDSVNIDKKRVSFDKSR